MLPVPDPDPDPHAADRLCIIGEADPFLARLLARFVDKSGLRSLQAQTGEAVLALAQAERPALILLEPELPGKLRGWEAARALGAAAGTAAIAIILCTWLEAGDAQALAGEAYVCLRKPDWHYEDFVAALAAAGVEI